MLYQHQNQLMPNPLWGEIYKISEFSVQIRNRGDLVTAKFFLAVAHKRRKHITSKVQDYGTRTDTFGLWEK